MSRSFYPDPAADSGAEHYDYERQAWVIGRRYVRCGHPEGMVCGCYGRAHAGEIHVCGEACR